MKNNPWEWDWNAVAAIGQCAGALGTFIAIWIALRQNKPKIKIKANRDGLYLTDSATFKPIEHIGNIRVNVVNMGASSVEITMVGYKMPHACYTTTEDNLKKLPKMLKPGENIIIDFSAQSLKNIKDFSIFYAVDNVGRIYYHEACLIKKIKRFVWWNIGKHFGKYRKFYKINSQVPK